VRSRTEHNTLESYSLLKIMADLKKSLFSENRIELQTMNSINTEKVFFFHISLLVGSVSKYVEKREKMREDATKISFEKK
jgi:hypothetical protein